MDDRCEIGRFLASRRARVTPEQAGLPTCGGSHRTVRGLRREEVALLAGVGVDHYDRLERGVVTGVSDGVLDALALALRLDDAERTHLRALARAALPVPPAPRRPMPRPVRPGLQRLLDAMTDASALVCNGRLDVVATNRLGRALHAPVLDDPARPANLARFLFLDLRAHVFHSEWSVAAGAAVARLRSGAGRDLHDAGPSDLVEELSSRSETFGALWARHDLRPRRTGVDHLHHPVVGDLSLAFEAVEVLDPGLTLVAHTAEPGTPSRDALALLASWAVTVERTDSAPATGERA